MHHFSLWRVSALKSDNMTIYWQYLADTVTALKRYQHDLYQTSLKVKGVS